MTTTSPDPLPPSAETWRQRRRRRKAEREDEPLGPAAVRLLRRATTVSLASVAVALVAVAVAGYAMLLLRDFKNSRDQARSVSCDESNAAALRDARADLRLVTASLVILATRNFTEPFSAEDQAGIELLREQLAPQIARDHPARLCDKRSIGWYFDGDPETNPFVPLDFEAPQFNIEDFLPDGVAP